MFNDFLLNNLPKWSFLITHNPAPLAVLLFNPPSGSVVNVILVHWVEWNVIHPISVSKGRISNDFETINVFEIPRPKFPLVPP